ncbi:helix-turn-helix transcriptional regulator [Nonomuraea sp. NN258]|uniref:ArsR/SmtB family transcription factor n=1 Tax=Nonomuraea antri TaxID=2730852 RepID=UPI001568783A|nr:helix-turn-helix domain-containing protein [Nonomuraea antri]NRQ33992.1 helix-turn-helix transcriptional regulator [Nonomuraea antri]
MVRKSKGHSARTLDANALKSFAHPLRLRIYELIDVYGPSTATRLAGLLGQNTGATSYHLRELARHGMIEVAEGLGRGKEKYWRVVPGGFSYGAPDDPEAAGALQVLLDDLLRQRAAELARWREEEAHTPDEWVQASLLARRSLRLTPAETTAMRDEVLEVLQRYRELSDARDQAAQDPSPDPSPDPSQDPSQHPSLGRVVVHFDVLPTGLTTREA